MAESPKAAPEKSQESTEETKLPTCGIIMPISGIEGTCYSAQHWNSVWEILGEAVRGAGFEPRMVSDSDPTAIIQRNIVNNLYYDPIVVCDVSSKNPNVMFELGLRLAFDKPVVITIDDNTNYTFDIGIIQHIPYPCNLDYHAIQKFISTLSAKIKATYTESKKSSNEHSFLRNFWGVKPGQLSTKDVDTKELLIKLSDTVEKIYNATSNKDSNYMSKNSIKKFYTPLPYELTASDTMSIAKKLQDQIMDKNLWQHIKFSNDPEKE